MNSLIVTLGVASVLAGIVTWYTNGASIITNISPTLVNFGSGDWLGIPRTIYFLAVVAGLAYYVLEHRPYGRYLQSTRFNVLGTMVAIFFLAFSVTGLSLAGVANWINDVFNGAALFLAVLVSTIVGRKRAGLT